MDFESMLLITDSLIYLQYDLRAGLTLERSHFLVWAKDITQVWIWYWIFYIIIIIMIAIIIIIIITFVIPLCRAIIYLKQTMILWYIVLQLFCICSVYYKWCYFTC